jgi:predicted DNA-binding transcriptional regulator AlpA
MNKHNATSKVQKMRNYHTDDEVCKKIGISKPTLYVRLKTHNWKISEIYLIEKIDLL